jgi:hypothetical protein
VALEEVTSIIFDKERQQVFGSLGHTLFCLNYASHIFPSHLLDPPLLVLRINQN